MKIAVFTDVHANYPALDAVLTAIDALGCDLIVHTGDVVAIGPHPAECLERLLGLKNGRFIMGNHDAYFAFGLEPHLKTMSDGEIANQQWTHQQLSAEWQQVVQKWPYAWAANFEGVNVLFTHYGLNQTGQGFVPLVQPPTIEAMDKMFALVDYDLVFYGHEHAASDLTGRARYVNPGSLGCQPDAVARFVELDCENGRYTLTKHAIRYDDTAVFQDMKTRQMPTREFICRVFFGNRWTF